jgi:cytochrome c556
MAKNFPIPSNPADRDAIMKAVKEMSGAMTRAEGEKDYIKETLKKLEETFNIPKKMIQSVLKAYHKDAANEVREANAEFEELLDALIPPPAE